MTITVVMVMMMVSDMRILYSGRGSLSLLGKQPDLPNVAFSSQTSKIPTAAFSPYLVDGIDLNIKMLGTIKSRNQPTSVQSRQSCKVPLSD